MTDTDTTAASRESPHTEKRTLNWTKATVSKGNSVDPEAKYSLSTIAESGYDWAPAAVAHVRAAAVIQRGSNWRNRDCSAWAANAEWLTQFGASMDEIAALPTVTTASAAASIRMVEGWAVEDREADRRGSDDRERPVIRSARSLTPAAQLDWLATGRIPMAAVTLLVGAEGIGKSLFWTWLTEPITTGKPCPEYGIPARDPAHVFIVATEDDWATSVLPRLEVAGADLDYVHVICTEDDGSGAPVFPRDIDVLAASEVTPALVVVDAWLDTVPSGLQVRDPQQARQALHPWREYAASTRASVLLLTHTNRVATDNARDMYGITSELRKKARSTLFAQADPQNADCVLIGPEKSNIAGQSSADRFRISPVQHFAATDSSDGKVPQLAYVGPVGKSARELITAAHHGPEDDADKSDLIEAERWLEDYLRSSGRTPSKAVKDAARANTSITERTLKRAASKFEADGQLEYRSEGFPRTTSWEWVGGERVDPFAADSKPDQGGEQ